MALGTAQNSVTSIESPSDSLTLSVEEVVLSVESGIRVGILKEGLAISEAIRQRILVATQAQADIEGGSFTFEIPEDEQRCVRGIILQVAKDVTASSFSFEEGYFAYKAIRRLRYMDDVWPILERVAKSAPSDERRIDLLFDAYYFYKKYGKTMKATRCLEMISDFQKAIGDPAWQITARTAKRGYLNSAEAVSDADKLSLKDLVYWRRRAKDEKNFDAQYAFSNRIIVHPSATDNMMITGLINLVCVCEKRRDLKEKIKYLEILLEAQKLIGENTLRTERNLEETRRAFRKNTDEN